MFAIKGATVAGGELGYETAARRYVNSGIKNLNLKPRQEVALRNKLIPLVANQMKSERGRTLSRAEGIQKRETKKKNSAAARKVMGSK